MTDALASKNKFKYINGLIQSSIKLSLHTNKKTILFNVIVYTDKNAISLCIHVSRIYKAVFPIIALLELSVAMKTEF